MFAYSLKLALSNLTNRFGLTLLTIAAIAVGLGLLTIITTMGYRASKIPLYEKSEMLHTVLIDSRESEAQEITDLRRMPFLTFRDTLNIYNEETPQFDKTYLWKSFAYLNDENSKVHPRQVRTMAGLENFFSFFDVPFLFGSGWTKTDDRTGSPVVILSFEMNQHFFGGENSVGRSIRLNSTTLTVIGVLARWRPASRFYDRSFSTTRFDDIFIPSTLAMNMNLSRRIFCWQKDASLVREYSLENLEGLKASECTWMNLWVNLKNANSVREFEQYLSNYVANQRSLGRIQRLEKPSILNVKKYTELNLGNDSGQFVFMLLAVLFFLVCLLNTVGILLAKYMGKVSEVALRRALGAKKYVVLMQYLLEVGIIAFIGGVLGLLLSYFGLYGMMQLYIYQSDFSVTADSIRHLYQLDWVMIVQALAISIGSSLFISLFPIWKICNTPPASQLKAQ